MASNLLAQGQPANFGGGFKPPTQAYNAGDLTRENVVKNMELIISNGIGLLTLLASLMFILFFITGSIEWVTSAGEKAKIQKARDKMTQSAIGLAIVIMAYSIIGLIGTLFGITILRPGVILLDLTKNLAQ